MSIVDSNLQKTAKEGIFQGILDPKIAIKHFTVKRYDPSADLMPFVDQYWIFRWDLRGQPPYVSEALPSPSASLVIAPEGSTLIGVTTGKFARKLTGAGAIIRIKFRPGGFYPFWLKDMSELTDKVIFATNVFPELTKSSTNQLLALSDTEMVTQIEEILYSRQLVHDSKMALVDRIITFVKNNDTITSVKAVAKHFGISERTLQNVLKMYVGVGLKWIIMRYRLREAASRTSDVANWTQIAADLGYSSQQHFTYDFKRIVGRSPSEYSKIN